MIGIKDLPLQIDPSTFSVTGFIRCADQIREVDFVRRVSSVRCSHLLTKPGKYYCDPDEFVRTLEYSAPVAIAAFDYPEINHHVLVRMALRYECLTLYYWTEKR